MSGFAAHEAKGKRIKGQGVVIVLEKASLRAKPASHCLETAKISPIYFSVLDPALSPLPFALSPLGGWCGLGAGDGVAEVEEIHGGFGHLEGEFLSVSLGVSADL